jgi:hypothetical protein
MPWPDLTFVPEGNVTRAVWHGGRGLAGQPITFVSNGDGYLQTEQFLGELTHFVDLVIDRLQSAKVYDTPLAKEWQALRDTDNEEAAFADAAARLGLDPYSMAEQLQEDLVGVSQELDQPLLDEFLDSADPGQLGRALNWLREARSHASRLGRESATVAASELRGMRNSRPEIGDSRPWERGYAAARWLRDLLGLGPTGRLEIDDLVHTTRLTGRAAGIEGLIKVSPTDRPVLVLPTGKRLSTAVRFAQARSLGLILTSERDEHLLDPVSTDLSKESRAFAAELLAPAAGIARYFAALPAITDSAFDAVAARFRTSTYVIRYQYENQVTAGAYDRWWL